MVPKHGADVASALAALRTLGFTPWQDGEEDVFCYQLVLSRTVTRPATPT
ncbi:MAG: hypothetical protein AB7V19_07265 [Candidatus Bipolaricaulia bacterium]